MNCICFATVLLALLCVCYAAPIDTKDSNQTSKSAFGAPFDEIVVESSLTVKRKPPGSRIGRNQNVTQATITTITEEKKVIKRQIGNRRNPQKNQVTLLGGNSFGAAAADAQAQAFKSIGPVGSFGSSATGAQTQAFNVGPKGPSASAGFSGTQQYQINGQTVDIAFGNTFSGASGSNANAGGAAITVTGPDGKQRPLNG